MGAPFLNDSTSLFVRCFGAVLTRQVTFHKRWCAEPRGPAPDDLALAPGGRGLGIDVENHVFGVSSFFGLAKRAEGGAHAWLRLLREQEKAVGSQKRQSIK